MLANARNDGEREIPRQVDSRRSRTRWTRIPPMRRSIWSPQGHGRVMAIYHMMTEPDVETALRFPWTSIGSDAGASATEGGQDPTGPHAPARVRQLSARHRALRPRARRAHARGGHPQDDVVAGHADAPRRPRRDPRRPLGRRRRLRLRRPSRIARPTTSRASPPTASTTCSSTARSSSTTANTPARNPGRSCTGRGGESDRWNDGNDTNERERTGMAGRMLRSSDLLR